MEPCALFLAVCDMHTNMLYKQKASTTFLSDVVYKYFINGLLKWMPDSKTVKLCLERWEIRVNGESPRLSFYEQTTDSAQHKLEHKLEYQFLEKYPFLRDLGILLLHSFISLHCNHSLIQNLIIPYYTEEFVFPP